MIRFALATGIFDACLSNDGGARRYAVVTFSDGTCRP